MYRACNKLRIKQAITTMPLKPLAPAGAHAQGAAPAGKSAPVSQPGVSHLLNSHCTCTGTNGESAAPAAMPAELRVAAPQPQLSRRQQQALLMLGLVLIAVGQWQRLAPVLARTLAALLSREVLATLVSAALC